MALDIYFSEDIRNALLAADEASSSTVRACALGGNPWALQFYLEGYRAALDTIALAFGIPPSAFAAARGATTLEMADKTVRVLERE